jgi:hypothetical protein
MLRTIYQRLCQLLRSLLGRAGSDPDNRAEQDTDHDDTESGADADHDADAPDRPGRDAGAERDDRPDDLEDDSDDQSDDDQDGDGGGGAGGAEVDVDAEADAEADVDADPEANAADQDDQDASEDVSINHSGNEEIGISWPRRKPEPWPDRPDDPENTIEVRLYHNDPDMGLQACRQVAPHLEWALLDAWADRFDLDAHVTVREEPVGDEAADAKYFDNWIWTDECEMAKDANMLIVNNGQGGAAGGYSGFVEEPSDFEGFGHDPGETDEDGNPAVIPYGGGEARLGVNCVIHEVLHCLGISHNGRFSEFEFVDWYSQAYLPPLWTTYRDASRFTIRLCEANRRVRPSVQ